MYRKWQIFANQKYTANNKTGWANITIWEFKHKKSKFILYKSIKCKCAEKNNHSKSKLFKLITFFPTVDPTDADVPSHYYRTCNHLHQL